MRSEALAYIERVCSDQDLLRLTSQLRHWKRVEEDELKKLAGETLPPHKSYYATTSEKDESDAISKQSGKEHPPVETTRPNVSPGEPSISKIGSGTKDWLLDEIKRGNAVPTKFIEHAKLLWKRNEVKYDGKGYYL